MEFWSRLFGKRQKARRTRSTPSSRAATNSPSAVLRQPIDEAILDVRTTADEIVVRLAGGVDPAAHPVAQIAWTVEHYRLKITNGGMRDVSADEGATMMQTSPDVAAGLTAVRVFGFPLVLARGGQDYAALFDAVRERLAAITQPMRLSAFQQAQKDAVEQVVTDMEDRVLSADDQALLGNMKGMLHWSY